MGKERGTKERRVYPGKHSDFLYPQKPRNRFERKDENRTPAKEVNLLYPD
jgi:hypothetical protein